MIKQTLVYILAILLVVLGCKEKKEDNFLDTFLEISGYTLANTTSRCQISSANNTNYFASGTTVSGTGVTVDRIDTSLPAAGTVEIYYPRGSSVGLPIVVLFQGGNVHGSFYSRYASRIAASGYVVYVPNKCSIFFTQYFLKPSSAAGNEIYVIAKSQNADTSSALFGRLDPEKIGFLGHSLGGVTALYALNGICQFPFCDSGSSYLSQVKVALVYGAGLTNQLDSSKILLDSAGKATPVAYLQGELDSAFPVKDGQLSYDNYKSTKYLVSFEGANHYSLADVSSPFGATPEKNNSTVSLDSGISRISQVTLLFLNGYLKGNQSELTRLQTNVTGITGVSVTASP